MIKIFENYPDNQYIKKITKKEMIVLHHTVSSNARSAIEWWKTTKERVGTAYIIEKNGNVIQLFEPEYWAYHIGKGSIMNDNMKSIGIELVNEGPLKLINKKYYWWNGQKEFKGNVYDNKINWRGERYYAKYPLEQMFACTELINELCKKFNIAKNVNQSFCYEPSNFNYKGIVAHHNLRSDKSDVSIGFNYELLKEGLK